mgnify:CR=1 FL=1
MLNQLIVDDIIKRALQEDMPFGDITTDNLINEESISKAVMIAKENGVIAGLDVAARVFEILDEKAVFKKHVSDGCKVSKGDIIAFGKLLNESHNSLRDLYEVTGKELDSLVNAALSVDGTIGSRMTGAGFGGCTVSIVKTDKVDEFKEKVYDRYTKETGLIPEFYVSSIGDGAGEYFFE